MKKLFSQIFALVIFFFLLNIDIRGFMSVFMLEEGIHFGLKRHCFTVKRGHFELKSQCFVAKRGSFPNWRTSMPGQR